MRATAAKDRAEEARKQRRHGEDLPAETRISGSRGLASRPSLGPRLLGRGLSGSGDGAAAMDEVGAVVEAVSTAVDEAVDGFPVVIVGAGPVGMVLAAELALAGVTSALLERRPSQALAGSRAGGLQSRAIEVFDQRGIADRFLAEGTPVQVQRFGDVTLDISDFPTRHPYGLGLWQNRIERILAEWIAELGVRIRYDHEVTGVEQDATGVTVQLADGRTLRAQYLV